MTLSRLRRATPLVALTFALVLAACEGSPVPLSDPPSVPVDSSFSGTWELSSPDPDPPLERLLVLPFNRTEYYVEYYSAGLKNSSERDTTRLRAFLTDVAGRTFANIQCLGCDSDPDFLFMEVALVDGRLRLAPIDDALYDEFTPSMTPEEARSRLAKALAEGLKSEEPAVFIRVR